MRWLFLIAAPALAHETWLQPTDFTVAPGAGIVVDLYNGEDFAGTRLPYPSARFAQLVIELGDDRRGIPGAPGQIPAIQGPTLGEGLHLIWYQSAHSTLTYDTLEDFAAFAIKQRAPDIVDRHAERGLPEEDIREVYFRYTKTLIAVGAGAGADRLVGLPFELVALTNPYADAGPQRFQLHEAGTPVPDWPVYVLTPEAREELITDAEGIVEVAARTGPVMVNAVKILPATDRMQSVLGASWQSLWANVTYAAD